MIIVIPLSISKLADVMLTVDLDIDNPLLSYGVGCRGRRKITG